MAYFIKFLIYHIESVDGRRSSLTPLIKSQINKLKKKFGGKATKQ